MTVRAAIARLTDHEGLNFLLTNRVPRRALTRFVGWFSKIEQPLVRDLSIATWRLFCDVDLSRRQEEPLYAACTTASSASSRTVRAPIDADPAVLVSPCDAIVGACGDGRRERCCCR